MLSKTKIVVITVGIIFGIPTSILGVQLKEGMFLKQMLNCQEDASNSVMSLSDGDFNLVKGSDFDEIANNLKTCTNNINPRIGVVRFVRNEHQRNTEDSLLFK